MNTDLLSPKELAVHVGWPERRIRNLITENKIRHLRIGGQIFAPKDSIEEFIKSNMIEPTGSQEQEDRPVNQRTKDSLALAPSVPVDKQMMLARALRGVEERRTGTKKV